MEHVLKSIKKDPKYIHEVDFIFRRYAYVIQMREILTTKDDSLRKEYLDNLCCLKHESLKEAISIIFELIPDRCSDYWKFFPFGVISYIKHNEGIPDNWNCGNGFLKKNIERYNLLYNELVLSVPKGILDPLMKYVENTANFDVKC